MRDALMRLKEEYTSSRYIRLEAKVWAPQIYREDSEDLVVLNKTNTSETLCEKEESKILFQQTTMGEVSAPTIK